MDDKARKRGGGAVIVLALVVVLVFLPMLYMLSVGPAVWACNNFSPSSAPALERIYTPLNWIVNHVPVVGPALVYYVEWWWPGYSAPTSYPSNTPVQQQEQEKVAGTDSRS